MNLMSRYRCIMTSMKIFSQNHKFILYTNMCPSKYLSNCCPIYLLYTTPITNKVKFMGHFGAEGKQPIITYYLSPQKCDHLVCDEIMMVLKDVKHNSFAVDTFVDKSLSHLKEKGIPVKRIIMWSDNCGTQYKSCKVFNSIPKFKSCKVFNSMSKFRDIPVMYNYFCAKHGKAEADGAIVCLSMHLDAVVRSGSQEFSDAGEVVHYCNLKLWVHNPDDDATGNDIILRYQT